MLGKKITTERADVMTVKVKNDILGLLGDLLAQVKKNCSANVILIFYIVKANSTPCIQHTRFDKQFM